jgi:DNA-binding phage protein
MSAVQLARAAGCERKIIYPLLSEPYKAPHFGNLIEILNALGMKQITITWRDDDENTH